MPDTAAPKVTVLCGGVGGGKFLLGVREHLRRVHPDGAGGTTAELTAIVNTGDDMWLTSLRITPDLDSVMYALAGVNDTKRGWGRLDESERVSGELNAFGVAWPWFTLGDLDLGTHITRTHYLRSGLTLSEATARITARWPLGATLLPATDSEVETRVVTDADGTTLHFEEWWTRYRASMPALAFQQQDVASATPAPGVLAAIADADVVLLSPSNPVVSIGTILGIPGIRDAIRATSAPVIGVSPIISDSAVLGMADQCLTAIGVETSALAVGRHYGARSSGGVIDGWLVDTTDAASVIELEAAGLRSAAVPLWMRDPDTSAQLAADALALALSPA
jgi:LPPG:FO 2-phospho-L-lactate transferase